MKNDAFILHIRLTTKCNADCDYCSSYDATSGKPMDFNDFEQSILRIKGWIQDKGLGHGRKNLTVQYLGGELLTIPFEHLSQCVHFARQELGPLFEFSRDGAQTNLIGSREKVRSLVSLFGAGSVGTSVDSFTTQRKVKGSADTYRTISSGNQAHFKVEHGAYVPGILVVDEYSLPHLQDELERSYTDGYHLTLRPVFSGGSPSVRRASIEKLTPTYLEAFNAWALHKKTMVQPFYQLLASRLGERFPAFSSFYTYNTGCPFQYDCTKQSLDLEPNGDIYVCMDMADSKQFKLGNAISGEFNQALWERLGSRGEHLDQSCRVCPYRASCQGGCMSEAIHHHNDPFAKTEYCGLWKALFKASDDLLDTHGPEKVSHWLKFIETRHSPA
jgi:radical SAM protein with 4Fe4S-binding SPASM domain